MRFGQLSKKAQSRAVRDYKEGWEETHPVDDLTYDDVLELLMDSNGDDYDKSGKFVGSEN